jgi:hypothetical protein
MNKSLLTPFLRPLLLWLLMIAGALPAASPTWEELNTAFGCRIWQDDNIFDDDAADAAGRLRWRQESRTEFESSYRRYANSTEKFLGVRPYSLALYGSEGRVSQVSVVLTNKGDVGGYTPGTNVPLDRKALKAAEKAFEDKLAGFEAALDADARTVEANLTALLGEPTRQSMGMGKEVRERVSRWNVGTQAILLCVKEKEYVRVVLMPGENADNGGRTDRITTDSLRERLAKGMRREPNGDVLIPEIPMVNQGNKGFCGPATFERILRHLGTPVDMYVLAMAAGTEFGGGTSGNRLFAVAAELAKRSGREADSCPLDLDRAAKVLEQGVPLVWTLFLYDPLEQDVKRRTPVRSRDVTDQASAEKWKHDVLKPIRKSGIPTVPPEKGHFRLIVGYNATTGEIAFSDSWGGRGVTWITIEEAKAANQGDLYYLAP